jgi:hypothetical protein
MGDSEMTKNNFLTLCGQYCIDPGVALESDEIIQALKSGNDNLVSTLLKESF